MMENKIEIKKYSQVGYSKRIPDRRIILSNKIVIIQDRGGFECILKRDSEEARPLLSFVR